MAFAMNSNRRGFYLLAGYAVITCIALLISMRHQCYQMLEYGRTLNVVNQQHYDRKHSRSKLSLAIPRIIHQVWDTNEVPDYAIAWIQSWSSKNPNWEHWFWTLDDVRQLVKLKFPDMLHVYDHYKANLFRADFMRYVVIYTFGGFYIDLDTVCLRSLDELDVAADCIVGEEQHEHTLIYARPSNNIFNSMLLCRPNHPFLKSVIEALPQHAHNEDIGVSTGPLFFDKIYRQYALTLDSANDSKIPGNRIAILSSEMFNPVYDRELEYVVLNKCSLTGVKYLPAHLQKICAEIKAKRFENSVSHKSFAMHFLTHFQPNRNKRDVLVVHEFLPELKNVSQIMLSIP